jgi:hypothetical protein
VARRWDWCWVPALTRVERATREDDDTTTNDMMYGDACYETIDLSTRVRV